MKAFLTRALVFAFPCVAIAQIAVLQIQVLEGEGAVHPAGARVSRPLTVEVTDESGRPVAGAAVSFQLPAEGPSGLFSNGLRTDLALTDAAGRASIHALQWNRIAGQVRIRITAVKEQARAGAVTFQFIGENRGGTAAGHETTGPAAGHETTGPAAGHEANGQSPDITPTTAKMGSGVRKKWIVLGALAAGGGLAFLGVSRAGAHSSMVSSSVVSIGTPTVTVGNP